MSPFNPRFKGKIEKAHMAKQRELESMRGVERTSMNITLNKASPAVPPMSCLEDCAMLRKVSVEQALGAAMTSFQACFVALKHLEKVLPNNMEPSEVPLYYIQLQIAARSSSAAAEALAAEVKTFVKEGQK